VLAGRAEIFRRQPPGLHLIHAGLQTDAMRIEIEVTARLRRREGDQF
jgi:hypothetical protein